MQTHIGFVAIEWVQVGVALVAGGTIGAFINAFFAWRRDRLQPISYRLEEVDLFAGDAVGTSLVLKATERDGWNSEFNNMHIVEICVFNNGSKNFSSIPIKINLPDGDVAVKVTGIGSDRNHKIERDTVVYWKNESNDINITLSPFNRKDEYAIRIFAYAPFIPREGGDARISSMAPVKFVPLAKAQTWKSRRVWRK